MNKIYIPHKIKVGDITYLSDQDSKFLNQQNVKYEDNIYVQSPSGTYLAVITDIQNKHIEVEIIREIKVEKNDSGIYLIQSALKSVSLDKVIHESVQLGLNGMVIVISEYSSQSLSKVKKLRPVYIKKIEESKEQSRYQGEFEYINPEHINSIQNIVKDYDLKLALSTEAIQKLNLNDISKDIKNARRIFFAIGPEKGWSRTDISTLKKNGFKFVQLKGNILRAQTTPIVVGSILKYIKGEI